jgi:hypothetical protein
MLGESLLKRIRSRIEALTDSQVVVLLIVGGVATYVLWGWADNASRTATMAGLFGAFGKIDYPLINRYRNEEVFFRLASLICGVGTVSLVFTWFRKSWSDLK